MPLSTLADRLAAVRAERGQTGARRVAGPSAAVLARAFGGRVADGPRGEVVVVERAFDVAPRVPPLLEAEGPACYFDTETTGLSTATGTILFLGGVAQLSGGTIVVTQFLLPDQPHEGALLELLANALKPCRLVTYNGRAFDVPLLVGRMRLHGLDAGIGALPARHDDLLPDARRLWRRPLGGARLADVERGVLGIRRASDCPSVEIPARYLAYLRGASPRILTEVVDHNAQDVVSLVLLEARLRELEGGAWRSASGVDPRGMALQLLRRDRVTEALELLEIAVDEAGDDMDADLLRRLAARTLLTAGRADRAEDVWRAATRRASVSAALAWVEVARIRERWRSDLAGALDATIAASRVLDLALALGRGGGISEIARARLRVESRRRRLTQRVRAAERACRATSPASPGRPGMRVPGIRLGAARGVHPPSLHSR